MTELFDEVEDPGCPDPPHPSGRFQFGENASVAIDSFGDEYVAGFPSGGTGGRIDIFDSEGQFITELATPGRPRSVAVDSEGNLYVFEQAGGIYRYSPSAYLPATGQIEYPSSGIKISESSDAGLAIDVRNKADASDDRLFVAEDLVRLTEYGSKTEGNPVLHTVTTPPLGSWDTWAAVDSQRRRVYVSFCKNEIFECGVAVFDADSPYALLEEIDGNELPGKKFFSTKGWLSLAVDEETGHVFVGDLGDSTKVYEFNQNFKYASTLAYAGFQGSNPVQIAVANDSLNSAAVNFRYLFVPRIRTEGNVFAFEPPSVSSPEVESPTAVDIGESEAKLGATVDPRGATAEYFVEYLSEAEFEAFGWAAAKVAGKGIVPASGAKKVGAVATGLSPGTAYRFRVRATNEIGGGEAQGGFSTYLDARGDSLCANQERRSGPSVALPDCRAYELVTPSDTGGLPPRGVTFNGDLFPTLEASPDGGTVSFVLKGGTLPGEEGNGGINGDQYRATRGASGWSTASLGPSGSETTAAQPGSSSPDQGFSFWTAAVEGPAVIGGRPTSYVRYPDGHLELVGRGSLGTDPRARGKLITAGGTHIVFQTANVATSTAVKLEPEAPPDGTSAIYDRTADEVTHVVSLLPGDLTPSPLEGARYLGASADGSGIAFEIGGKLYLRKDNSTTYPIGTSVDSSGGHVSFAGVSEGGERVFYLEGGDLLAFDTTSNQVVEFSNSGDVTPVNVAPAGTRAYFVSPSVLTGGANPQGETAQAGEQNLYLSEEGEIRFAATVTDRDVTGKPGSEFGVDSLGSWVETQAAGPPSWDPSRLTPDGSVLLFQSRAELTGYEAGESPQVYRYDSRSDTLRCLSCIPTGLPSAGGASLQSVAEGESDPAPLGAFGFVQNLRSDGARAFFQSVEALVSTDTDETQDVYEWEEEGIGSCTRPGGCVYLISSGQSGRDNYLYASSQSGDDVFFTSGDLLTSSDTEAAPSLYDARVNGGFAETAAGEECEGEGCRPVLTPAPAMSQSESGRRSQSGNVARACPKGKQKVKRHGKPRCVKKKPGHRQHKKHHKHRESTAGRK